MQWIQAYLHHKEFWKPLVLTLQRLDGSFQVTGLRLCVNMWMAYITLLIHSLDLLYIVHTYC